MEYIYGTAVVNGAKREILKVIGGEKLCEGEYFTSVREYEDCTITDHCRIERMYHTETDSGGKIYRFYAISEHYRDMDRTKKLKERADEFDSRAAELEDAIAAIVYGGDAQ